MCRWRRSLILDGPWPLSLVWQQSIPKVCLLLNTVSSTKKITVLAVHSLYYIEKGMGKNWKWLAKLFAFFAGVLVGIMGIGTITQINGISTAVQSFFDPDKAVMVNLPVLGAYPLVTSHRSRSCYFLCSPRCYRRHPAYCQCKPGCCTVYGCYLFRICHYTDHLQHHKSTGRCCNYRTGCFQSAGHQLVVLSAA